MASVGSSSRPIDNAVCVKYSALYNLPESDTNSFEYNDIVRQIDERVN